MSVTDPQIPHVVPPQPDRIIFFDTTLRDGEQSPGCVMHGNE